MTTFSISNQNYRYGLYEKDFGNFGIHTANKTLYIRKILFPKSFFIDNDIVLVLKCENLDRPLFPPETNNCHDFGKNCEYKQMITISSVDLIDDGEKFYKYEPPHMPCRKLYPANGQPTYVNTRTLQFSFNNYAGILINSGGERCGPNIQIKDQFIIEFLIDD